MSIRGTPASLTQTTINGHAVATGDWFVTDQSSKLLMTVAEDGTVVPKPVRVGPTIDGLRVIRSGIDAKDRVVIDGLVRARPGAKVTPQPGEIKAAPETAG